MTEARHTGFTYIPFKSPPYYAMKPIQLLRKKKTVKKKHLSYHHCKYKYNKRGGKITNILPYKCKKT